MSATRYSAQALIIKEAKYLDRLGFHTGNSTQIALKRTSSMRQRDHSLKLSQYDSLISRIAPVEDDC